ncbi:MAG: helix-turn-helix domain-containing protein [Ketobacteraceae bacterium]|nr:helix-turn-helix domain-containing protein [Ketobacteraceae bacterium]
MERHIQRFVNEWSALKDQDVLEFLRDSMPYVSGSNLPLSQLNQFLDFVSASYREVRLELQDEVISHNGRTAAQWQLVCARPGSGLVIPESVAVRGSDFIRSSGGMIRDLDVYFDFNDVAAMQRMLTPATLKPDPSVAVLRPPRPEYRKSGLSTAAMEAIAARLTEALSRDCLYRENDLNLPKLAACLNVRPDYLSQVISQRFGSGFYQLISGYRIAEAKRLLLQEPRQAVVDIGFAVGFNSKSVFYSEFRKQVAMTPAGYRKQHLAPGSLAGSRTRS